MKQTLRWSVFAALVLATAPAFAIGAIAVDDEQGVSANEAGYGFSTGHATKDQATAAAISECKRTGNATCTPVLWFETCGAYAGSREYWGIGYGTSERQAIDRAIEDCGDSACRVVVSGCE